MLYLNELIVRASGNKRSDAEIIAHIINAAPKFYNIPLSIISQSDINASNALSKAQTELRNYWKKNLEGKIGKQQDKQWKEYELSRKHQSLWTKSKLWQ
jgi:predicted transcriptional regulator